MCWNYLVVHRHEILFAAMLAIIVDLFRVGSSIRSVGRFIRNKWAEKSVGRIRKRIRELEVYRDSLASYLISDKAHYLSTLRNILALLVSVTLGISILVVSRLPLFPRYPVVPGSGDLFALICFAMAIVIGVVGLQIAAPDYQSKISKMIVGVDANIAKLSAKLPPE